MPYCCQCGNPVGAADGYCGSCGAEQNAAGADARNAGASGAGPSASGTAPPPSGAPRAGTAPSSPGAPPPSGSGGRGFPAAADVENFWNRNAALLCYIPWLGWIAAIIVLASDRYRRDYEIRFHAFQGLYLFIAWLLIDWVISPLLQLTRYGIWQPLPHGGGILHLLVLAGWIVMIVKVRQREHYRLPILGDLAERSVAEQRAG